MEQELGDDTPEREILRELKGMGSAIDAIEQTRPCSHRLAPQERPTWQGLRLYVKGIFVNQRCLPLDLPTSGVIPWGFRVSGAIVEFIDGDCREDLVP
jgi:hypothetical protein